jgi:hypothetical protein
MKSFYNKTWNEKRPPKQYVFDPTRSNASMICEKYTATTPSASHTSCKMWWLNVNNDSAIRVYLTNQLFFRSCQPNTSPPLRGSRQSRFMRCLCCLRCVGCSVLRRTSCFLFRVHDSILSAWALSYQTAVILTSVFVYVAVEYYLLADVNK